MSIPFPFPRWLPTAVWSALVFTLAGCETVAPTAAKPRNDNSFQRESVKQLQIGMTKSAVIELLGQPTGVTAATPKNEDRETWVYEYRHEPIYRSVAVEMEEVAYVDPITGIVRTILDPRQQLERITVEETFTVVFDQTELVVDLDYDISQHRQL